MDFRKDLDKMTHTEQSYFRMEAMRAVDDVKRRYASRGPTFLLALGRELRDSAGRDIYNETDKKENNQ